MNFNQVSSSSSSDDEELIANIMAQQQAAWNVINNNNMAIAHLRQSNQQRRHGGSVPGHITIYRDREAADARLYADYFADNAVYTSAMFRRRYRMSRSLFLRMVEVVTQHDEFFQQLPDNTGRLGFSPLQKATAAIRILAYGVAADSTDEYLKMSESTAIKSMKRFCRAIIEIYSSEYLRTPNANDIARLLYIANKRGFPGMLGSLDCMHWRWQNYPTAWQGSHAGHSGFPTLILEAVADYDLWIWHAYFDLPGTNNDINVLDSSHLFQNLASGIAPPVRYVLQGKEYNMGYYLADDIYPKWRTIVQTIQQPRTPPHNYFAMKQEACRKDVERAFRVLKQRFTIVARPARYWKKEVLHDIMTACIIMHNMIVEDERDLSAPIENVVETGPQPHDPLTFDEQSELNDYVRRYANIRDQKGHYELRNALVAHLWAEFTNSDI